MASNEKKQRTIAKRQSTLKKEFLALVAENGIVQVACRKIGIGRQTYYRWLGTDYKFAEEAARAILRGRDVGCDMAESVVIGKIMEKDIGAAKFFLQHNHQQYMSPSRWQDHPRKKADGEDRAEPDPIAHPQTIEERQNALKQEYEQRLRDTIVEEIKDRP